MHTDINRIQGSGKTGRPPELDKTTLLNIAEILFADRGFKGTTVREIAKKAHCNVALISYHFGSKDGLYQAIWMRYLANVRKGPLGEEPQSLELLQTEWPELSDMDELRLCGALYTFAKNTIGNPRMQKILFRELLSGGQKAVKALVKSEPGMLSLIGGNLNQLVKAKKLRDDFDIKIAVISLIGPIIYSCVSGPILKSVYGFKTIDDAYARKLVLHLTRSFFNGTIL